MKIKIIANSPKDVSLEVDGKEVDLSMVTGLTLRLDPEEIVMFVSYSAMKVEVDGEAGGGGDMTCYGEREWTMEKIAEALAVSQATISRDLFTMNKSTKRGRPKGSKSALTEAIKDVPTK